MCSRLTGVGNIRNKFIRDSGSGAICRQNEGGYRLRLQYYNERCSEAMEIYSEGKEDRRRDG